MKQDKTPHSIIDDKSFSQKFPKLIKQTSIKKKTINKNALNDSLKLSFFGYYFLILKNIIKRKKDKEVLDHLELCTQIKKKILNESSIYMLFLDIAKLKRVVFNDEQLEAFEKIRTDFKSIFQDSKNKYDLNTLFYKFNGSSNPLEQKLAHLITATNLRDEK